VVERRHHVSRQRLLAMTSSFPTLLTFSRGKAKSSHLPNTRHETTSARFPSFSLPQRSGLRFDLHHGPGQGKLEQHGVLEEAHLHTVKAKDKISVGCFTVEFFQSRTRSWTPFLAIKTPVGNVIHTGDFKMIQTPDGRKEFDLHTLASLRRSGVLALFSDSTNGRNTRYTPSSAP